MTTITATETDLMQRLRVAGDGKQFEVRGGSTHGRSLTVDELIAELSAVTYFPRFEGLSVT
ncbi:hypothetical protein [Mycolicibacterium lutetiense]|uniref:Uncharacterized protein n=1 Tax=Mycolicibacterium lutetiense TaxID=1641992 RepID=A0ABS4ZTF2_9MYCO|nr:hypothetical protein [Mycolicibacterium lutetiense]MBP2451884.1 hypothetical protein [Mycolicibacterium lutetiense]